MAVSGAKQRSLSSVHERWRRPDAAPSTKGSAKAAKSQSGESTDTGATGDPTNDRTQKPDPCASVVGFLSRVPHGAGLIVAAFSARDICDASSSPAMVVAIPRRLWPAENRALTSSSFWSSWRLSWSPWQSSLLSSLSLPCLPRGVGWLDECADAANQRAHHQANTKLAKTIPRQINARP
jgi:hypothetical protein